MTVSKLWYKGWLDDELATIREETRDWPVTWKLSGLELRLEALRQARDECWPRRVEGRMDRMVFDVLGAAVDQVVAEAGKLRRVYDKEVRRMHAGTYKEGIEAVDNVLYRVHNVQDAVELLGRALRVARELLDDGGEDE